MNYSTSSNRSIQNIRLQKNLAKKVMEHSDKEYLKRVDELATKIKLFTTNNANPDEIEVLFSEVYDVSDIPKGRMSEVNMVNTLREVKETIELIEDYSNDPLVMIPSDMLVLNGSTKNDIEKANYFQLTMALIYARGSIGDAMNLNMGERKNAISLHRLYSKDKQDADINETPAKTSKRLNLTIYSSTKKADTLMEKMEERFADKWKQGQNLNGLYIKDVTPNENINHVNFNLPPPTQTLHTIKKEKRCIGFTTNYI